MSLTKNEIKFIKSLHTKKQRDLNKMFIVEGEKMISELLVQSKFKIETIYYTSDYTINNLPSAIISTLISSKDLDRISGFNNANKVLAIVHSNILTELDLKENNLILILDDINDPGNLGTII
jgi:TrmH family RNA methyltransferase